jgi:hypothetical protein
MRQAVAGIRFARTTTMRNPISMGVLLLASLLATGVRGQPATEDLRADCRFSRVSRGWMSYRA